MERDADAGRGGGPLSGAQWWQGPRGEWFVAGQFALLALVVFGPRTLGGWPPWRFPLGGAAPAAGLALVAAGALLAVAAVLHLWNGRALTALPHPTHQGTLVEAGPYALARHPIYGGTIAAAFGWALAVRGWLTLLYALALFLFLDVKARREERWLAGRFAGYAAYQRRIRRLIPFVY